MTQKVSERFIDFKAAAWTIGVHLLLLLLFFWLQYAIPVASNAVAEMGLEVNLGNSEDGSGANQPVSPNDPGQFAAAVVLPDATQPDLPKDLLTGDDASNPSVPATAAPLKTPTTAPVNPSPQPRPVPKYVYGGEKPGTSGNKAPGNAPGQSEGNTNGPGDRGVPGGTPGAPNYTGGPGSGGIGHTLTGRKISPDRFEAEFKEGGKVVIHVTVDRDGNIVSKYVKSSSNQQLTRLALEKLNGARFSKSAGTEPQQFGDVTIVFRARE